jgi:hypothetical protein
MIDRKKRFWIEAILAGASGVFFLLTVLWDDWIEVVFGVDPDHGDGGAEWAIAIGAAVLAIVFGLAARIDWRKLHPTTT